MAVNFGGQNVHEVAVSNGREAIWIEVLADCGYDLHPVYAALDKYGGYQKHPGMSCFPSVSPIVRSTKLSFANYCHERKSFAFVRDVEGYEWDRFIAWWALGMG